MTGPSVVYCTMPGGIEPVTHPRFGDQIPRIRRVGFQLLAQLTDVDAQVLRLLLGCLTPHGSEQGAVREDAIRVPRHEHEQVEFLRRQPNRLPVQANAPILEVDVKFTHPERQRLRRSHTSSQRDAHPGEQVLDVERLDDVVVRP